MILSLKDEETEKIANGGVSRKLPADIQMTARRKLRMLNEAVLLSDLRALPGNRLEALRGDRAGQHSIRVNDQWRICFVWQVADEKSSLLTGAHDVEITDYH